MIFPAVDQDIGPPGMIMIDDGAAANEHGHGFFPRNSLGGCFGASLWVLVGGTPWREARHGLFGNKAGLFQRGVDDRMRPCATGFFEMTGASPPAPSRVATVRS